MARRSSRRRKQSISASGVRHKQPGFYPKPLRPRRNVYPVQVLRPDFHLPYRRRLIRVPDPRKRLHRQDPRNYNEQILKQYSTPYPDYFKRPETRFATRAEIRSYCRKRAIRRAVLFAAGSAGLRGALSPRLRRLVRRKKIQAQKSGIRCGRISINRPGIPRKPLLHRSRG